MHLITAKNQQTSFSYEIILKLRDYGATKYEIAKEIGCSVQAINTVLNKKTSNLKPRFFTKILQLYCVYLMLSEGIFSISEN